MTSTQTTPLVGRYEIVQRSRIRPSKTNPRKTFDEVFIQELSESIGTHGLAQAPLVRPVPPNEEFPGTDLEIVAGEQRWRATGILKWIELEVNIREMTDQQALELQVIENLKRRDLHPLEEAEGFHELMVQYKYTAKELAAKISKSKEYIYASIKLLDLCEPARKMFHAKTLTQSLAVLIARIPSQKLQQEACSDIGGTASRDPMSQRQAVAHIQRKFMTKLKDAPFNPKDEKLLPKIGACTTCPKRTGNQPELFSDVESADVCTDTACFAQKRSAWSVIKLNKAKEAGRVVIEEANAAKKIFPHSYSSPNDGFKKPTDTCYQDAKNRTYGQIAKASGIDPIVVRNPHTQDVVEIIRIEDVAPALKELGISAKSGSMSESEKESIRKAKFNTEFRVDVLNKIRENMATSGPALEDWQMVAAHVLHRTENNTLRKLVKYLGWDASLATWDGRDERDAKLKTLNAGELADVIFTASIFGSTQANANYNNVDATPADLAAVAARHGVNDALIKAQHQAEAKAAASSKERAKRTKEKVKQVEAGTYTRSESAGPKGKVPKVPTAPKTPTPTDPHGSSRAVPMPPPSEAQLIAAQKEGWDAVDPAAKNPYPVVGDLRYDHWGVGHGRRQKSKEGDQFVALLDNKPKLQPAAAWPFAPISDAGKKGAN